MPAAYLRRLRERLRRMRGSLFRDLLINVTRFFRDADAVRGAARRGRSRRWSPGPAAASIRIWVPGCSSGEEAFSIAMLFAEEIARTRAARPSSRSSPPTSTRRMLRDRPQRGLSAVGAARRARTRCATSTPSGAKASSRSPRLIRDMVRFSRAHPHQGSAVLEHRPGVLPQPADLFRRPAAGAGAADLPLRPAPRRRPVPRPVGEPGPVRGPVRRRSTSTRACSVATTPAAVPGAPADDAGHRRRRPRSRRTDAAAQGHAGLGSCRASLPTG